MLLIFGGTIVGWVRRKRNEICKGGDVTKTRARIYYNVATMLEAGMGMQRSLRDSVVGLKGQSASAFLAVAEAVAAGNRLADSMAEKPEAFALLDVTLVKAGEISGQVSETLKLLSKWYEFRDRLRRTMLAALLHPILIFHVAAIVGHLPGLFLGSAGMAQYVMHVARTLALMYVPAAAILAIVRLTPREGALRGAVDRLAQKVPLLGRAIRHFALSRYCWAFHMIYKGGGVRLAQCAQMATDVAGNAIVTDMVKGGVASAEAGNRVSEGFSGRLPPGFRDAWQNGEAGGKLDEVTWRLAQSTGRTAELFFTEFAKWFPRVVYFLVCIWIVIMIFCLLGTIR